MCLRRAFIPRDNTGLHQRSMFGQWIYVPWHKDEGCLRVGAGEVPWVRGSGDQTELKSSRLVLWPKAQLESSRRALGRAPGCSRHSGNALCQQWATSLAPAPPWLYPSPRTLLQCKLKTTLETVLEKWLGQRTKGLVLCAAASAEVNPVPVTLAKWKSGPKLFCTKVTFLPSAMLPLIQARVTCKWPKFPSSQCCSRRDKPFGSVGWQGEAQVT